MWRVRHSPGNYERKGGATANPVFEQMIPSLPELLSFIIVLLTKPFPLHATVFISLSEGSGVWLTCCSWSESLKHAHDVILSAQLAKIMLMWVFCNVIVPRPLPRPFARNRAPKFNHRLASTANRDPCKFSRQSRTCCPWIVGVKLVWHLYGLPIYRDILGLPKNPSSPNQATRPETAFFVLSHDWSRGETADKFGPTLSGKWSG